MDFIATILLGLIQGAAELLPVSSSAHVILVGKFFGFDPTSPQGVLLLLSFHTGTMGAVLIHYRIQWKYSMQTLGVIPFVKLIVLSTGATVVVGYALKHLIERVWLSGQEGAAVEQLFGKTPLIASGLLLTAIVIYVSDRRAKKVTELKSLNTKNAFGMGAVQGLCLPFRGFSRSGATISFGLMARLDKKIAEAFSFALAVVLTPPLFVREWLRLRKEMAAGVSVVDSQLLVHMVVGLGVAFFSGYFALKWLSSWVERGKWGYFSYYCFALSLAVFALYFTHKF